jgi:hypothetical protein
VIQIEGILDAEASWLSFIKILLCQHFFKSDLRHRAYNVKLQRVVMQKFVKQGSNTIMVGKTFGISLKHWDLRLIPNYEKIMANQNFDVPTELNLPTMWIVDKIIRFVFGRPLKY